MSIPSHTNSCRMNRNELLPDFQNSRDEKEKDYKTIVLLVLGIFIIALQALPSLFSTNPTSDTLSLLSVTHISGNQIQINHQNTEMEPALPNQLRPLFFQPILINESNQQLLESIPGIGPHLSEQIVNHRNAQGKFTDLNELLKVHGIGEKKLAIIRKHTVAP